MRRRKKIKRKNKLLGIALAMVGSVIVVRVVPLTAWYVMLFIMILALIAVYFWGLHR